MPIAQILAPVTGGGRDAAVLTNAIEAARPFNAHVMAFFVRPDLAEALAFFTDGVSGVVVEEVVKATKDAGDEAAKRVEATIDAISAAGGITRLRQPARGSTVTLSLREVQGNFGDQLTAAARLSDLVVFGPIRENDQAGLAEAFVQVLVETDRPVLRATDDVPKTFARRIAIGWDGKTAAAQAVSAAIPYLAKADSVEILSIQRPPLKAEATEGLREYLTLHKIQSTERLIDPGHKRIGEALLAAAAEGSADLLVVGGYGRGRLRESLIGGVTRHVIAHAGLSVFMVH
ncbi:MAG TPA: universal stress protein [Micropepsaceae bacterium]|nr:universal stress protein [Micropepsaceae bacterium]